MNYDTNPFEVLYVTDSPDPRLFVDLFSDLPIQFSQPIFQLGNVVLKGTQGCGKSMLLNLLKPEIRLAYHKASVDFPVPSELGRFVGAGINLTLSGALDIGQRPVIGTTDEDEALFPLLFGDFLNYFIVRDLLRSTKLMAESPDVFDNAVNGKRLDKCARELSRQDCWFGILHGCESFDAVCKKIDDRIAVYRSFHQFNCDIPEEITSSKTNIGEPIARTEEALKIAKVIDEDTPVVVRIDQLEKLYRSDILRRSLGTQYRRIVNKALGKRDSRISYRIGTRPYAWDDDLTVFATDDKLEHLRDYRIIDLDEELRRRENEGTWVFPQFAQDTFRRRLKRVQLSPSRESDSLATIFGKQPSDKDVALEYARNSRASRASYVLQIKDDWPDDWKEFLLETFGEDPFDAKLAAAWALQSGQSGKKGVRLAEPPPNEKNPPWRSRKPWRKERVRQCLMQIAARCAQRQKWSGSRMILALSAPNISVFLSVCHEIWDAFQRSESRKPPSKRIDAVRDGIPANVQTVGIETASRHWYHKIPELPSGHDRQRFVDVLGRKFRKWLLDDVAMSYPGHNGFSLTVEELEQCPPLARFLQDAFDYGDLFAVEHTTKLRDRRRRIKWYLSPILSPFFQIPEAHTKEPYYTSIAEITSWLNEAGVVIEGIDPAAGQPAKRRKRKTDSSQRVLFGDDESREAPR